MRAIRPLVFLVFSAVVALASTTGAQSAVTAADLTRLEASASEISTQVDTLKKTDATLAAAATRLGVQLVALDELLRTADFVSIHCPLNAETRGLIGQRELALMKPSAYLINTARGGIVDEDALYLALRQGQIAGAAIDCFVDEPLTAPHRFGGLEYRLGTREIGHIHGDALVDIPFPTKVRDEIIAAGLAERHHVLPESGWVSFFLRKPEDVQAAIALFKRSYDIAVRQKGSKPNQ